MPTALDFSGKEPSKCTIIRHKGGISMDILSLKNISFQNILANISLNVPQNGFITLSGPSGSGKSTILKICARMLTQSTGELIFEGEDAAKIPVDKYRMQVSYCFQQPVLFGDTVADNLDFPFEIRKEPVKRQHEIELLERVNLSSSYLEKPIADLSGGEKQRVALIRNLMFKPKVLLLDEVTAGLDADNKKIVHMLISSYRKSGGTVIAVTHDTDELRQAEQIIRIEEGRIIEQ